MAQAKDASFDILSTKNLGALQTEKAIAAGKAKHALKGKIDAAKDDDPLRRNLPKAQQPPPPPAPLPPEKRPLTLGQAQALSHAAAEKQAKAAEPARREKIRKLIRYKEEFPKATAVIARDIHPDMSEKAADAALLHVYTWLGTAGAKLVLRKAWLGFLKGTEYVVMEQKVNPMNWNLGGLAENAEFILKKKPEMMEPEMTEAEIELGSWLVKPWYVRIVAKTFDFIKEYNDQMKTAQAKELLAQKALKANSIPTPFAADGDDESE